MSTSVVIPAYNAGSTIARAIRSVLGQTLPPEEVIVVDDGSTDDTAEAVSQFGRRVTYIKQSHLGPGAARNKALQMLKGDWIAFLDSDDEWLAHKLETQMKIFEANPELYWGGANSFLATGEQRTPKCSQARAKANMSGRDFFDSFLWAISKNFFRLHPSTVVIKREVFDKVGLFSEELLRNEDTDMWCRIAFIYPKFGFVPEPLAIAHLDAQDQLLVEIRLDNKSGTYFHKMVQDLFPLAEKHNSLPEYTAYASLFLRRNLIQAIFFGLKDDARKTVSKFKGLFPWYLRAGTYLLTVFPKLTARILRALAYFAHIVRGKRSVTRRWYYSGEKNQ